MCDKMFNRCDNLYFLLIMCSCLIVITKCQLCEDSRSYYPPALICKNISGKFPVSLKSIHNMKCIDCNIPTVDENTIANFKGDIFNLSYSHVQNINSNAFKSFDRNIHKFLFQDNDIIYIAPKVFSNFSVLDDIVLRKNNITELSDGIFENTNVTNLDLSHNHLSNVSTTFAGLKVNTLNLSYNEIVNIPKNAFEGTTFWRGRQWRQTPQQIDLSYNFIEKIYADTFKSSNVDNTVSSLSLKNNKLTTVENNTFSQLNFLTFLTLDENYIAQLYMDSFKGLTNLKTLSLKKNAIEKIPLSMFADLQNLESLDLSLNQLTTFTMNTFSGLTKLTKLNISHNNIRVLDDSHLFPIGQLTILDITDIKIKDLNLQAILEHHYKLRVLVINDNFWMCKLLVQMYKHMNERMGGFDYPTHHYDVPNLHGIACSRQELVSYSDMKFDDFLNVISQDRTFEDLFDSRINNQYGEFDLEDTTSLFAAIRGIFYMLLVITIISTLLFVQFIVKSICQYFYRRNILPNDKFCFAYTTNQDNVELI